jgi:hypothetical protein
VSVPERAASLARTPEQRFAPDHPFLPVNGHPDDDECTHRSDGTDATYCGRPNAEHERDCDRCGAGALFIVRCAYGCQHAQCGECAAYTEAEAKDAACCPQVVKTGVCYCQEDDRG